MTAATTEARVELENPLPFEVDRLGHVLGLPTGMIELATQRLVPAISEDGRTRGEARIESLTHPSPPRPNAGLLAVLAFVARQRGIPLRCLRHSPVPRNLPPPDLPQSTHPDICLVRLLCEVENCLVGYDPGRVQVSRLIAQIATAWPDVTVAVATATSVATKTLHEQLEAAGIEATLATPKSCPERGARVVVGTFGAMWHHALEFEKRDFVIVPNATDALLTGAQNPLCDPGARFRLVGLLPLDQRLSPRQQDWLVAAFGVRELVVPRHGSLLDLPAVLWLPCVLNVPQPDDVLGIKRQLIWRQQLRNRQIATIAKMFAAGNCGEALNRLEGLQAGLEINIRPTRVIVLVENLEHAIAVADRLPGWPIIPAPRADLTGLSEQQQQTFTNHRPRWTSGEKFILTTTAAAEMHPLAPSRGTTVVLWAGGGGHRAPIPDDWFVSSADCMTGTECRPLPLLVVDVDDRRPAKLAEWSRARRRDYEGAGWFAPSPRPELPLVTRFLARRPGGVR